MEEKDSLVYHIAENFRGRKLSRILRFCGYTRKFFSRNLGRGVLWCCKSKQSAKVFSVKIVCSLIHKSESFPLYGILLATWVYLPSHKDAIRTLQFLIGKVIRIKCLQELCKRRELSPVFLVHLLWCIPLPGQEGVPPANYLSLKKRGQSWVLLEEGGGGNRKRREGRKKWGKAEVSNWNFLFDFVWRKAGFEGSIFSSSDLKTRPPPPR